MRRGVTREHYGSATYGCNDDYSTISAIGGRQHPTTLVCSQFLREAPVRIELTNSRFAVCRLTTWPRRRAPKLSGPQPPEQTRRKDTERQAGAED